jgi:hypothetical protein
MILSSSFHFSKDFSFSHHFPVATVTDACSYTGGYSNCRIGSSSSVALDAKINREKNGQRNDDGYHIIDVSGD